MDLKHWFETIPNFDEQNLKLNTNKIYYTGNCIKLYEIVY